jgi:hypothetical protein
VWADLQRHVAYATCGCKWAEDGNCSVRTRFGISPWPDPVLIEGRVTSRGGGWRCRVGAPGLQEEVPVARVGRFQIQV